MSDDFIKEERKWAREEGERADRRADKRREHRTARIKAITTGLAWVLAVAIISLAAWRIIITNDNNDTLRDVEHERTITACTTSGGSWVSINGGDYACIRIGGPL